jgi:hypothetical protein
MQARNEDLSLYRLGAWSAIAIVPLYVVITGLYVMAGPMPVGAAAWLAYAAPQVAVWWAIAALSVLTDLLYLPVEAALYRAIPARRTSMLVGAGLLAVFVVLDLAVTWPSIVALIGLGTDYAAGAEASQETLTAAAAYPAAILGSSLLGVYAILIPAVGLLAVGHAQLGAGARLPAYAALATGIGGVIAVVGGTVLPALGMLAIPTAILTTIWFLLAGLWLRGLGSMPDLAYAI